MKRMSRVGRFEQILDVICQQDKPVTTSHLARLCDMSPSPHFRSMVYELAASGQIYGGFIVMRNGRKSYLWSWDKAAVASQCELPFVYE